MDSATLCQRNAEPGELYVRSPNTQLQLRLSEYCECTSAVICAKICSYQREEESSVLGVFENAASKVDEIFLATVGPSVHRTEHACGGHNLINRYALPFCDNTNNSIYNCFDEWVLYYLLVMVNKNISEIQNWLQR